MTFDTRRRPNPPEEVRKVAAAYLDRSLAPVVVGDLVKAGMSETDVTIMPPWPSSYTRTDLPAFLDRPWQVGLFGALVLGVIASAAALFWADLERWLEYGLLGAVVGAASSSLASALSASSPPHWHDRLLGDRLGAVTIEVTTTDRDSAERAKVILASHEPSLVQSRTEPGPRPPSEHVLWHHRDGISPLVELDSWINGTSRRKRPIRRRGRHLEADRAGPG